MMYYEAFSPTYTPPLLARKRKHSGEPLIACINGVSLTLMLTRIIMRIAMLIVLFGVTHPNCAFNASSISTNLNHMLAQTHMNQITNAFQQVDKVFVSVTRS